MTAPPSIGRPAAFLDRDGVLNARRLMLVRRPSQVRILPGVGAAVRQLNEAGLEVCLATNQEWVGMGYLTLDDHEAIMAKLVAACEADGGRILAAYACTHARGDPDCDDNKPKPGMLQRGAREHGLDLSRSYMVGDNAKDLMAGRNANVHATVLVDPRWRTRLQAAARYADHVCHNIAEAATWIDHDFNRAQ